MKLPTRATVLTAVVLSVCAIAAADAQQHHGSGHGQPSSGDARQLVALPVPMQEHMLANMRDHLLAVHEIHDALARNDTDSAARIAEQRLGMMSMEQHGASHMAPLMPEGMREVGTSMHRAASRFAIVAKDAGVTGDVRPALAALAAVSSSCISCHAAYRVR